MVHIKCDNCGEEFPEEEIENHRLRCIYTIKDKELENLIPCEICNQLINFENYHQHLLTCYEPSPPLNSTNLVGENSQFAQFEHWVCNYHCYPQY